MLTIGVFEAKAQLSQLIERVAQGEEVLVTRHGKPVARLVAPEAPSDSKAMVDWAADLRAFRSGVDHGAQPGSTLSELIAAGRR
jgi:prevent-host-death family protein